MAWVTVYSWQGDILNSRRAASPLVRLVEEKEIGSRVGRNQKTVMRIFDRWMQEGTTDRHGRSHPPQSTSSCEDRQIERMAVTDRSVTSRTKENSPLNL
ncbi:transposable element Tcb1 transposase [Trichonephila clavipes]|uniref:Transposable element Tcb1 transposase n=1 Tax=Trichonephila clavipes TaxID=2585209 RepID=A0A8X6S0P0_TRICX|nr:transposable element Tcb1 transposase [Trichonephila clavipes]